MYPPTYLCTHLSFLCNYTYPPTHPPIHPPTHLPTHPPTHPPTHLVTYLPTYPPTHPILWESKLPKLLAAWVPCTPRISDLSCASWLVRHFESLQNYKGSVVSCNALKRCNSHFIQKRKVLCTIEFARYCLGLTKCRSYKHNCLSKQHQECPCTNNSHRAVLSVLGCLLQHFQEFWNV